MMRLRVGDWVFDPALNQMHRGSEVVHLEPKVVEVLLALTRRPGQVVSRDALLSEVWAGIAVSDDVLTQSVTKLRQAFGDSSRVPSYIQTISKRGYRLIAQVTANHGDAPQAIPVLASGDQARRRLTALLWIFPLVAAGAALAAYWGLASPVWRPDPAAVELPSGTGTTHAETTPEVAIEPFKEIEGDQLQNLLARGFAARLITDLSRFSDVRVVRRKLAVSAGEPRDPLKTAGGNYVVAGEVQRHGENIRVYIHLTDAASGRSLWSEQYDSPYTDLFSLQDDLTRQILSLLRVKLSNAELARGARPYTRNLQAYEEFLRAQSALIIRSKADNDFARQHYIKAIELDPAFARAYAGLALTYAADRRNFWSDDGAASLAKALELARKAQQADPDIPEPYFALAYVLMERGDFSQAVEHLRTALRLSASFADAYALLAAIRTYQGRPSETIPLIRTAMRLVPDAGHLYFLILGRAYYFLGDPASAVLHLRKANTRNPENLETRIFLAVALKEAGQREEAAWEVEEIRAVEPTFNIREWLKSYPMADSRQFRQLIEAANGLGL